MQKGFTLIELLGIIVLLGVIIAVAVPSLITSNKNAENSEKEEFNEIINTACESYINVHSDEYQTLLTTSGRSATISVSELISSGYLRETTNNPNTDTQISEENGSVTAKNSGGKITCTYNS